MDITIVESKEHLADLLYEETDMRKKERLQFLYWHKSGLATTRSQLAALLCKSLPTITAWACLIWRGSRPISSLSWRTSPSV